MAIKQSDILAHNNPDLAVADSDFIKGGFRTHVATIGDLFTLSGKIDLPSAAGQLKEHATIVYVTGSSKYYVLNDITNVGNINGWGIFNNGSGTSGTGILTDATNGLHITGISGNTVALGGTLTGATIIVDSRATKVGIEYAADYSGDFVSESLITKRYADAIVSGLKPKQAVSLVTTSDILLTGNQTIDGVITTTGMRVLVKNQNIDSENGVYIANSSTWVRSSDFDGTPAGEVVSGSYMWVLSGNTNTNTSWVLATPDPININTTPLTFVLFNHIQDVIGGIGTSVTMVGGNQVVSISLPYQNEIHLSVTGATGGLSVLNREVCLDNNTLAVLNSSITGATNGLTKIGQQVFLGGNLINNTYLGVNTYDLLFSGATGSMSSFIGNSSSFNNICINNTNVVLETQNASNCASVNLCQNTNNLSISTKGGDILLLSSDNSGGGKLCITAPSGATYDACYHSNYTNRSLVDKEYVDNKQNIVNVRYTYPSVGNEFYLNTSDDYIGVTGYSVSNCMTVYLLDPPIVGQKISIADIQGQAQDFPITINSQSMKINGFVDNSSIINTDYGSISFIYNGKFWSATAFIN